MRDEDVLLETGDKVGLVDIAHKIIDLKKERDRINEMIKWEKEKVRQFDVSPAMFMKALAFYEDPTGQDDFNKCLVAFNCHIQEQLEFGDEYKQLDGTELALATRRLNLNKNLSADVVRSELLELRKEKIPLEEVGAEYVRGGENIVEVILSSFEVIKDVEAIEPAESCDESQVPPAEGGKIIPMPNTRDEKKPGSKKEKSIPAVGEGIPSTKTADDVPF